MPVRSWCGILVSDFARSIFTLLVCRTDRARHRRQQRRRCDLPASGTLPLVDRSFRGGLPARCALTRVELRAPFTYQVPRAAPGDECTLAHGLDELSERGRLELSSVTSLPPGVVAPTAPGDAVLPVSPSAEGSSQSECGGSDGLGLANPEAMTSAQAHPRQYSPGDPQPALPASELSGDAPPFHLPYGGSAGAAPKAWQQLALQHATARGDPAVTSSRSGATSSPAADDQDPVPVPAALQQPLVSLSPLLLPLTEASAPLLPAFADPTLNAGPDAAGSAPLPRKAGASLSASSAAFPAPAYMTEGLLLAPAADAAPAATYEALRSQQLELLRLQAAQAAAEHGLPLSQRLQYPTHGPPASIAAEVSRLSRAEQARAIQQQLAAQAEDLHHAAAITARRFASAHAPPYPAPPSRSPALQFAPQPSPLLLQQQQQQQVLAWRLKQQQQAAQAQAAAQHHAYLAAQQQKSLAASAQQHAQYQLRQQQLERAHENLALQQEAMRQHMARSRGVGPPAYAAYAAPPSRVSPAYYTGPPSSMPHRDAYATDVDGYGPASVEPSSWVIDNRYPSAYAAPRHPPSYTPGPALPHPGRTGAVSTPGPYPVHPSHSRGGTRATLGVGAPPPLFSSSSVPVAHRSAAAEYGAARLHQQQLQYHAIAQQQRGVHPSSVGPAGAPSAQFLHPAGWDGGPPGASRVAPPPAARWASAASEDALLPVLRPQVAAPLPASGSRTCDASGEGLDLSFLAGLRADPPRQSQWTPPASAGAASGDLPQVVINALLASGAGPDDR